MTTIRQEKKRPTVRAFTGLAGRPFDGPTPDPFADRTPLPPLASTLSFGEKEVLRKQKKAQAARARRKLQREQIDAIREKLKVPVREIKRAAEEQAKLEKQAKAQGSMRRGMFIADAPMGKGELVTGGYGSKQLELMIAAYDRAAALGSPSSDETGGEFWPDNDRRSVVPQGSGGNDGEDSGGSFHVRLGDGVQDKKAYDYDLLLGTLVDKYCVKTEVFTNEFFYCVSCGAKQGKIESIQKCIRCEAKNGKDNGYLHLCRLCGTECDGFVAAKQHIHRVHGSENHPEHDHRYGDITRRRKHPVTA